MVADSDGDDADPNEVLQRDRLRRVECHGNRVGRMIAANVERNHMSFSQLVLKAAQMPNIAPLYHFVARYLCDGCTNQEQLKSNCENTYLDIREPIFSIPATYTNKTNPFQTVVLLFKSVDSKYKL